VQGWVVVRLGGAAGCGDLCRPVLFSRSQVTASVNAASWASRASSCSRCNRRS